MADVNGRSWDWDMKRGQKTEKSELHFLIFDTFSLFSDENPKWW